MHRVPVTRYERGVLLVAVLADVAALALLVLGGMTNDQRLAMTLLAFSQGVVFTCLVLRAERRLPRTTTPPPPEPFDRRERGASGQER